MLFFIDESWQVTQDNKYKVGVLSAVQIKSHDFNECSKQIRGIKIKHLGPKAGYVELKGTQNLRPYLFSLEAKGVSSNELNLIRDIFVYMKTLGIQLFASIVFAQQDLDLACANVKQLERPFFYLFERIDLFMKENQPGLMAKIIFDDRGVQNNKKISASISNFFHKSLAGQSFDSIIKVPFFGISTENVGIQIADIVAYVLGNRFTGKRKQMEFFKKAKEIEFKSRTLFKIFEESNKLYPRLGFKVIKEKETGNLYGPGRTE